MSKEFKKDIKEIVSTITREEFLSSVLFSDCPSYYDLDYDKSICNSSTTGCIGCWESAVKDIKFKDDINNDELIAILEESERVSEPKEYTIHNIINDFEEGIVFEYMERRYKIYCGGLYCWNTKCETPMWKTSILTLKEIVNMKFTRSEQLKPMTFEKASKTGKNVRYEYPTKIQDKFYPLNVTIQSIGESYDSEAITNIILKGTWFAEGVYE